MNLVKDSIALLCAVTLNLVIVFAIFAETNPSSDLNTQQISKIETHGEYVRKRFLQLMKKPFDLTDPTKTKILIIGDSHAQDFLNSIAENKLLTYSQIRTRYIPTRCQIFLGAKPNKNWIKKDINLCVTSDNLELAKTQIANADVIILVAMWRKWAVIQLPKTLKNLNISADQKVFVIGRRSFLNINNERIKGFSNKKLSSVRNEVDIHQLEINKLMNETLDKRIFINVHKLVCGTSSKCPVFTDRLKIISFDGGHLSQDGARYIGRILFQKSKLKELVLTKF